MEIHVKFVFDIHLFAFSGF